ncbi:biotin--[acetyl-CoA-carboxylase] ligase [Teichococcus aestuarii]|uniref:biotin--[acetyl-CoA-carboxylase] ligase n=1 Tax=Teichococcus aestuarii TaxID=568898 RepID=UPI0036128D0E
MTGAARAWRLRVHDELASTQDGVLAAAQAGEPEGLAILARRQSAGRGTQGRSWRSPEGNLYLSFLLRPEGSARELPQWSLLMAVALAEALAPLLPDPDRLRLKWPNDVLLDGAKCAGILTQAAPGEGGGIAWLVFGIGVNLAEAPLLPDRPTASLRQAGVTPPEPVAFAWSLLSSVDRWRGTQAMEGFAPVREAWTARGPALGATLRLSRPEGGFEGRYRGLSDDGRLLLDTASGRRALASGEVLAAPAMGA